MRLSFALEMSHMKRIFSRWVCLFLFAFTLSSAHAFSNKSFKGRYAFGLVGASSLVLASEPRTVATGVFVADGNGHVTGHGSFRSGGVTCLGNINGNYSVNTDGTGILSSNIQTSTPGCFTSVLDLAIVLANQGKIIEAANTENDYMSGTLTQQTKTKFTLADLNGTYAWRLSGPSSLVIASESETVGVGILTANGKGQVTGTGTLRSHGLTCHGALTGNYTVAQDGTGLIGTNFSTTTPGCFNSVIDLSTSLFDIGNGAALANSENDYMAGSLHRQIMK